MKKKVIITTFLLLILICMSIRITLVESESQASILNIDSIDTNQSFIQIKGWKLSTIPNTKINVFIDDIKINENYIEYSYKYALTSIVKGYGTAEENPTPNFDVNIPIGSYSQGEHRIKIQFVTEDEETILKTVEENIFIDKGIKFYLNIDTKLNNEIFYKKIHIEGWKLATIPETKLNVYIDNIKVDEKYIKYSYKYALTSIVKGYGTAEENPIPNFDIDILTDEYTQGKHTLKIDFLTQDEKTILKTVENTISIDKGIKSYLNIDTKLNNEVFNKKIHIEGWKLATIPGTKLNVYIDNIKVDEKCIKYSYKYALTSIVKGYGTAEENPIPNFDIDILTEKYTHGNHEVKIDFVSEDEKTILKSVKNNIKIDKSKKSYLNIDTDLKNSIFTYKGIKIKGWKLATAPNTKLNVYIDNIKVDDKYIKYSYQYALTSIVKGYGDAEDNPEPNFDINIPIEIVQDGKHALRIELVDSTDEVLKIVQSDINTKKSFFRIHIESIFNQNTITNELHTISGWLITHCKNEKIRLMIDGEYQEENFTRLSRSDVLRYFNNEFDEENEQPGFSTDVDFSKLSIGLHQIAIRVFDEEDKKIGEEVIYIFLKKKITYEEGTYGVSGYTRAGDSRGSELKYYRYGDGPNVFFATFSVHGFEDNWAHDGAELTYIANQFYENLKSSHKYDEKLANKWTIYILPMVNPDGQTYGYTNNGPGRTTMYSSAPENKGIDLNRCWKYSGFNSNASSRNYEGTAAFQAFEAQYLRDFLISHKSKNGQTVLVDLHGWLQQFIGDREVGMYYAVQFPENNGYSMNKYGDGYLINWARTALASNGRIAKAALIELPGGCYNHQAVLNRNFAGKYIQATLSMLNGII